MFEDWSFERVCREVAACGYDGIEIAPFTLGEDPSRLTEQRATEFGRIAHDAGLTITGFHWLLAKPPGLHLTTPDDPVRHRTTGFLQHLARCCAAMGGHVLVLGSPRQRDLGEGVTYQEAFDRAAQVCRDVCETAHPLGITLALEPLGPQETTFLVTTAQAVELLQAVDHPGCRLHLDVKAMSSEGVHIPSTIAKYARHLAYFHANDANRRGPGFGDTDFVPILRSLDTAGYRDWVSVEVFDYAPDPKTIARQSIEYLRRCQEQA